LHYIKNLQFCYPQCKLLPSARRCEMQGQEQAAKNCVYCGFERDDMKPAWTGILACAACRIILLLVKFGLRCALCGKTPEKNSKFQNRLCEDCELIGVSARCFRCGLCRPIARKTKLGSVCIVCERSRHECAKCRKFLRGRSYKTGIWLCNYCNSSDAECSKCLEVKPIKKYCENGLTICRHCAAKEYVPPKHVCGKCGKVAPWAKRNADQTGLCSTCYERPVHKCVVCKTEKQVRKWTKKGTVCATCYGRERERERAVLGKKSVRVCKKTKISSVLPTI